MRKALISFVIILLLAAAAFIVGWVDLYLPAGSHAVFFTKTGGWYPHIVEPGNFTWMWQRLIPTNVTTYLYRDVRTTLEVRSEGTLPSGELYVAVLPDIPDFSYALDLDMELHLTNDGIYQATVDDILRPDSIDDYFELLTEDMLRTAEQVVIDAIDEAELPAGSGEVAELLEEELRRQYQELEILQVRVREARLPDLALYRQARENYLALVEAQREALATEAADTALRAAVNEQRVQSLSRIGSLLAEHPSLLEYLRFSADTESDPLGIQELFAPLTPPQDDTP